MSARGPSATVKRRIEFADTDASGRYHYATALRLFEAAEAELLHELGLLDRIYTSTPRKAINFEYHSVLSFMDEVEATVAVAKLGTTSVTYRFEASRDGELCVEGNLVAVFVDDAGSPRPWDDETRRRLQPEANA